MIDPIQSRCVVIPFQALKRDTHLAHLRGICEKEKIDMDDFALETLQKAARGDCRRSVTSLQAAKSGFGDKRIDGKFYVRLGGLPTQDDVLRIVNALLDSTVRKVDLLIEAYARGSPLFSPSPLLAALLEELVGSPILSDYQKAKVGLVCAELSGLLREGVGGEPFWTHLFVALHAVVQGPGSVQAQRLHDEKYLRGVVCGDAEEGDLEGSGLTTSEAKEEAANILAQRKWGHVVW